MSLDVHWHEGLFLQPHHFQVMQRGVLEQVRAERRLGWHYPYGVVEARLLPDELENGRIRFEKLHAVMPSGVEVRVPERAELPALDLKAELARSTGRLDVHLAVPLWMHARANTLPGGQPADPRAKLHYRLKEVQREDENTGDNPKPMLVRMVNARLLLEQEDRSDLETLPLLRIQRALDTAADAPRQDPKFVPPTLVLGGSPTLRRLVTELAAKVESSRDELAPKLARGGLGTEARFDLTLRLRTLGHFAGSLPGLAESPMTPPFAVYLALRALLGELAALLPGQVDPKCAPYNHDHPLPCFEELDVKIRRSLVGVEQPILILPFQANANGHPQATLSDEHLSRPTAYYLGVKTRVDRTKVTTYVTNGGQFKLMPASLEGSAIFGFELREENFPPVELPPEPGLYYFRVALKESRRWPTLQNDKSAVLEWQQSELDLADARFTLYMTLPATT